jgi:hypothetical protein
MAAFWDIAPCNPVEEDEHFSGAYCLHHQGDHGAISQKAEIFMLAAVRTRNKKKLKLSV